MAKNAITPEVIEAILVKITDKFTESINSMFTQFGKILNDSVNVRLATISERLDNIEKHIGEREPTANTLSNNVNSPVSAVMEATTRAMVEAEREKEEIRQRSRNIIITGLPLRNDTNDVTLVESFCEDNLTVKPHIIRARRIGRNRPDLMSKLCVTLDNADSVEDLLDSSTLLKWSSDANLRKVYFNRDLTPLQAEAAYRKRCEKRASRSSSSSSTTTTPFLASS